MNDLIRLDQQLLLAMNGSDSAWLDQVMLYVTRTSTWIPLMVVLLIVLLRNRSWREVLLFVVFLSLVILLCDQFASTLCKPLFQRFRPSHEPALEQLVDLVGDRRGGLYGFISSHAANTFGAFAFISLYLRRTAVTTLQVLPAVVAVLLWACLSSYSRIYLGLHYPGDILCGALAGLLIGYLLFRLLTVVARWLSSRRRGADDRRPVSQPVMLAPAAYAAPHDALLLPITFFGTLLAAALLA